MRNGLLPCYVRLWRRRGPIRTRRCRLRILNDLGNLLATQQKHSEAITAYEQSVALARQTSNTWLTAQSLCNCAATAARAGEFQKADDLNAQALREIAVLDASHAKGFLLLTAGQTDRLIKLTNREAAQRLMLRAHQSFKQASEVAEKLKDRSIETYALGYLGQLYEQDGQPEAALTLTRRATFRGPTGTNAGGSVSLGMADRPAAEVAGRNRTRDCSLSTRRPNDATHPGRCFAWLRQRHCRRCPFASQRDRFSLNWRICCCSKPKPATDPAREQDLLREARDTMEHLKAVEFEDYFCDECVDVQRARDARR